MHVKYIQHNLHRMTWYTGMCGVMAMSLLYMLEFYGQMCELYGPWIQWLFVAGAALMGGHYRIDIISGVGHPRLDSVIPLVLYTIAYNGWGIGI
jgi:hypothetical protein